MRVSNGDDDSPIQLCVRLSKGIKMNIINTRMQKKLIELYRYHAMRRRLKPWVAPTLFRQITSTNSNPDSSSVYV